MKLTIEQTDKILEKIKSYNLEVVDMEDCPTWLQQPEVAEDYFNDKVNEALETEEDNVIKKGVINKDVRKVIMHDLECLELKQTKDNKYHYDLLRNNLIGLLGEQDDE